MKRFEWFKSESSVLPKQVTDSYTDILTGKLYQVFSDYDGQTISVGKPETQEMVTNIPIDLLVEFITNKQDGTFHNVIKHTS